MKRRAPASSQAPKRRQGPWSRLWRRLSGATGAPAHRLRIAAVVGRFPVVSHTFVYQELLSMQQMLGAEVHLFHREDGAASDLHAAFGTFASAHTAVGSTWEAHRADFQYFQQTRPEQTAELLDFLAAQGPMTAEELERNFAVNYAFSFARHVETWRADYVHSYFFYDAGLCAFVASRLLGLKRGLSAYADHLLDDWHLKMVGPQVRSADIVVATSQRIRAELLELAGPEAADRILVKPNGIDGDRFPTAQLAPTGGRPFRLLCVARIEPKKGLLDLAEAVARLRGSSASLQVHVVGGVEPDTPQNRAYDEQLRTRIADLGLEGCFLLHGSLLQEDLLEHYARADAFVAPFLETSRGDKDGIPTALLEALCCGLPVVATDAGSIPEVLGHGVEGLIAPQQNPEALAACLQQLLHDPERARALGAAGRARFARSFDVRITEPPLHERIRSVTAAP